MIRQLAVPTNWREDVLRSYHDSLLEGGHQGFNRTYAVICMKSYWPKILDLTYVACGIAIVAFILAASATYRPKTVLAVMESMQKVQSVQAFILPYDFQYPTSTVKTLPTTTHCNHETASLNYKSVQFE